MSSQRSRSGVVLTFMVLLSCESPDCCH